MNSMSKGHCQDEKEECAKVLLKCKISSPVHVTVISGAEAETPGSPVITPKLAPVSFGTGHFHDQCVKLEFSTNLVSVLDVNTSVAITFQLYKLCKGETVADTIGNPWSYSILTDLTDIITFSVCDCDCDINDCCSYYVIATAVATATEQETPTTSTLEFNNPHYQL